MYIALVTAPFANFPPVAAEMVPPIRALAMVALTVFMFARAGLRPAVKPALAKPWPNLPPCRTLVMPPAIECATTRALSSREVRPEPNTPLPGPALPGQARAMPKLVKALNAPQPAPSVPPVTAPFSSPIKPLTMPGR